MTRKVIKCPDCEQAMALVRPPQFNPFDSGVSWGDRIFICINDDCPPYAIGRIYTQVGDNVEFKDHIPLRNICCLNGKFETAIIPYFTIITSEELDAEEKMADISGKDLLDHKDITNILMIFLNNNLNEIIRAKAAEILCIKGDHSIINVIYLYESKNHRIIKMGERIVASIAKRYYGPCRFCSNWTRLDLRTCAYCKNEI